MISTIDIWPMPGARITDPETSHEAASAHPEQREIDRDRALRLLREHPEGLTDFELGDLMGRGQTSAGKRRGELRDAGKVIDSGERRKAPSGSRAIVWRALTAEELAQREAGRLF